MSPVLSIVVIGRNEGLRLKRCLQSICDIESPGGDVELIYVDSASSDNSVRIAESFDAHVVALIPARPTAALGRNAGWRVGRAPIVLFVDGDTVLHPRFVADSLTEFRDPSVAAVWGHRREMHPEQSIFNRILDLDWIYKAGLTEFCGGDVLMRVSALREVGGYDEGLIAGEEPEMCRRMRARGYKILHTDRPMTGHDLAMTRFSQYWKRATRAGYAYAEVSERFRGTEMPFWEDETARNRSRALTFLAVWAASFCGTVTLRSYWPLVIAAFLYLLLGARTAAKVRWKSSDILTLFAYGIHSHLQQLPIYLGQLQFHRDKQKGRVRGLIEYKGVSQ